MDRYNEGYELIGLTPAKRHELAALIELAQEQPPVQSMRIIETLVLADESGEITQREISHAELVRTSR
jgi:hypothetical protein